MLRLPAAVVIILALASPASADVGAVKVTSIAGTDDRPSMLRIVKMRRGALRACVTIERKRGWFNHGVLPLQVHVSADGKLSRIAPVNSQWPKTMVACMSRHLLRLKINPGGKRVFRVLLQIRKPTGVRSAPVRPAPKIADEALAEAKAVLTEAKCMARAARRLARAARTAKRRGLTPPRQKRIDDARGALGRCAPFKGLSPGSINSSKPSGVGCPGCKALRTTNEDGLP